MIKTDDYTCDILKPYAIFYKYYVVNGKNDRNILKKFVLIYIPNSYDSLNKTELLPILIESTFCE